MEKKQATQHYNNAKIWQIGCFTLNNTSTNIALLFMMQYSYFTQNVLGLAAAIVGMVATFTRVFDAITDPIVGALVDKTNSKFGKFRPFMLIGSIIIWGSLIALFYTPPGWGVAQKYIFTTAMYITYICGYTCQTVVTKAAQTILTNNPKQRPIFSGFDSVFTQVSSALIPFLLTNVLAEKYSTGIYAGGKGLINPATWKEAVLILAAISFLFTLLAMLGISQKDRKEYYGLNPQQKIGFHEYVDVIKGNRAIQMLIVSAATDKLGTLLQSGTMTYIFANLLLNTRLQGAYSGMLMMPIIAISFCGVYISRKFGLKRTFLISTWASMTVLAVMFLMRPNPNAPYIFIILMIVQKCLVSMGSSSVIPMIADCTDYETSRSGRFVPGMMGTMFSFVDKIISSLSATIQGFALTLAGVGTVVITPNQVVNTTFNTAILVCFCIIPIFGHIASIIAMRFYKLDKTMMEKIQIKLSNAKEQLQ